MDRSIIETKPGVYEVEVTDSSNIKHLRFEDDVGLLTVTYLSGKSYEHPMVTFSEFKTLAHSDSVGKTMNSYKKILQERFYEQNGIHGLGNP